MLAERRKKHRIRLKTIIGNMQLIADKKYKGDLLMNVVDVFQEIDRDQQWTFLRAAIENHWCSEITLISKEVDKITDDELIYIDPMEARKAKQQLDAVDFEEQLKLKRFLIRFLTLAFTTSIFLVVAYTFLYGEIASTGDGIVKLITDVYRVITATNNMSGSE